MRATCWSMVLVVALAAGMSHAGTSTPWELYLSRPSPENARRVTQIAYSQTPAQPGEVERDLMLLAVQVGAADLEATRLAFRLRVRADGHVGEALDIMLGRLIRINPRLFLTTLRDQGRAVERLDALVGNFGDEYVDRAAAHNYEAKRRREALLSVIDRDLLGIRDQCVALLTEESRSEGFELFLDRPDSRFQLADLSGQFTDHQDDRLWQAQLGLAPDRAGAGLRGGHQRG